MIVIRLEVKYLVALSCMFEPMQELVVKQMAISPWGRQRVDMFIITLLQHKHLNYTHQIKVPKF